MPDEEKIEEKIEEEMEEELEEKLEEDSGQELEEDVKDEQHDDVIDPIDMVTEDDELEEKDEVPPVQDASPSKREKLLLNMLTEMKQSLENAISVLGGGEFDSTKKVADYDSSEKRILEGVFSGEAMIGADGKKYDVPANYASKSKLVEGDIMKLILTSSGNFIYKQIGPIARKRVMGELVIDHEKDEHWVVNDYDKWRILKASSTYYKGQSGDKVAFFVPQDGPSKWAAVENIIKDGGEDI